MLETQLKLNGLGWREIFTKPKLKAEILLLKLENTTAFSSEPLKFQFLTFALSSLKESFLFSSPKGRKPLSTAFFCLTTNPLQDAHTEEQILKAFR